MNRRAFTLVELLVVIAIICILASLLIPAIKKAGMMNSPSLIRVGTVTEMTKFKAHWTGVLASPSSQVGSSQSTFRVADVDVAALIEQHQGHIVKLFITNGIVGRVERVE